MKSKAADILADLQQEEKEGKGKGLQGGRRGRGKGRQGKGTGRGIMSSKKMRGSELTYTSLGNWIASYLQIQISN